MANSLAGVNLARISQLSLDTLLVEGIPLQKFVTDFSPEIKDSGESVTTRFAGTVTTQDFNASKAAQDVNTVARTITLDDYRGVAYGFTDKEMSLSDVELTSRFIQPAISALVSYVINKALALVTEANFSAEVVKTAAQFDADVVADLATSLDTSLVASAGRVLVVPPTYYGALVKDNAIQSVAASGTSDPLRKHVLPEVHGFEVLKYKGTIPTNSESLAAVACHSQALCIAARGVQAPPKDAWYGLVQDIVDPASGLPLQIRHYYDGTKLKTEIGVLCGVTIGVPANLIRIASA